MNFASALRLKKAGLGLALGSALVLAAVLVLQYGYGYAPCKLCLTERLPFYAALPLGLAALFAPERLARLALGLAALGLLYGAGLGVYHGGAEWGFWPGPSDCGGGTGANPGQVGEFLNALQNTKVVDCSVAALRILGISLAGWNAVVAFVLASFAGTAALRS
ncbi:MULTISPECIES: disulfide bond formation protein B [unclassified Methylobacterium]|uniref:disulfide bond formation protein B n=1 Tax=unclassified Methylobacterium TaxID=2615210 RepID=UPI0011C1F7B3|nr:MULTISPECIES: disulfide bond formation protein B [unclassified Methylobacterium]QEE37651.1 disulfide bond formation protein B [Methylobacterium sp. WL1]TXN56300.1 disulfide bond formation protein B [Methylobacterium sp. WL2]